MQQSNFEKLLADTLATQGRSPRTQATYTLMLRLFARYLGRAYVGKPLDTPGPGRGRYRRLPLSGWAGISSCVPTAASPAAPTTPVGIGTAPSVRS